MKKFLSLVLVLAMLASMIVINVSVSAEEATVSEWDGTTASAALSGKGTKEEPYEINSAADLAGFAAISNAGDNFTGKYVVQTVDIDLKGFEWTPIAYHADNSFLGVYDGQGHTISGLYISTVEENHYSVGLFGYIGQGASALACKQDCGVANLTIDGEITISANPTNAGVNRAGGLVGQINRRNYHTETYKVYITNVTSSVDVAISNISGTGSDIDNKFYWGGVAGFATVAVFENVVNEGAVSATNCNANHPVGGIAGRAARTEFISCVNNGNVTLATNNVTKRSYSGNNVSAFNTDVNASDLEAIPRAGGIVGQYIKVNASEWISFENCVNNAAVDVDQNNTSGSVRVHAGGILGSIAYVIAKVNYAGDGKMCNDYNITFNNCANTGTITANRASSGGETNAGGIIGTLYQGTHGKTGGNNSAVNVRFYNCVNVGTVSCSNDSNRAGGMFSVLHNVSGIVYDVILSGCKTGNTTDYASIGNGSKGFGECTNSNSSKITQTNCSFGAASNKAGDLVSANKALVAASGIEINGFPTGGVDTWDGKTASPFLYGTGTKEDPYLIRGANDLKKLANMVNTGYNTAAGGNTFAGKYVKQIVDIDLNNNEWQPIGYREKAVFQGVYDGDGHSVSGLKITSVSYRTGLFGGVGYVQSHLNLDSNTTNDQVMPVPTADCGIANLTVNGNITLDGTHASRFYYGGVVSYLGDEKFDCDYKAFLINVTSNVNITTTRFGDNIAVGGVVGHSYNAVIENAVYGGIVDVTSDHTNQPTGGIVGKAANTEFISCVNNGAITVKCSGNQDNVVRAGGIAGGFMKVKTSEYLVFTNCVNNGAVSASITASTSGKRVQAGGILGSIRYYATKEAYVENGVDTQKTYSNYNITFNNCVNAGTINTTSVGSGETNAGGIAGSLYQGSGGDSNNAGNIKFYNCVNVGKVTTKSSSRAGGMAGVIYTQGTYTYGVEMVDCHSAANTGNGNIMTNFLNAPQSIKKNCVENSADATKLQAWNKALAVPSLVNINGMPTAANVAVVTGLENFVIDLDNGAYDVKSGWLVLDEKEQKVTKITEPGTYTVVYIYYGVRPYVTDDFAFYYNFSYHKGYFTEDAAVSYTFGDTEFEGKVADLAKNYNNYTTYGKTVAESLTIAVEGILPQQINEKIHLTIDAGAENEFVHEYSLATYVGNMMGTNDALDKYLVDLVKYAAAAQAFKGQTEGFATEGFEELLGKGSSVGKESLENSDAKNLVDTTDNDLFTWKGATLVFDSTITMRLRFAKTPGNLTGYSVVINGTVATATEIANGYVDIEGFSPKMYADVVTVYVVDAEGNQVSDTVTYSVNSYIYNKWDAAESTLVQALANYSQSARDMLGQ